MRLRLRKNGVYKLKIKLIDTNEIVEALLDETHETACYLNEDNDDFVTITRDCFEILDETDTLVEEANSDLNQPVLTLAKVLGGKLKSLTVEFK